MRTLVIEQHLFAGFSSNTYFCVGEAGMLVIDPGTDGQGLLEAVGSRPVSHILLTHAHFDHCAAAALLRERTGAKICVHAQDAEMLADPDKNASRFFGCAPLSLEADVLLQDGDTLPFGEHTVSVLHTPGHSAGSVCYRLEDALFCGDTLFADGVGRTDLYGGSERALLDSLRRLSRLPGGLTAYAGHAESFSLSRRIAQMRV